MKLTFSQCDVHFEPAPSPEAPIVYFIGAPDSEEDAREIISAWGNARASMAFVHVKDWNGMLSPWPAKACFRAGEDFAGGADAFLNALVNEIVPEVEGNLSALPSERCLAGISLGGLFALYAMYRTDAFSAFASVSGSLWYDGFTDFMRREPFGRTPRCVYLSLGDREECTKNPRLRRVGDATREALAFFEEKGISCKLEMNPGNHFVDGVKRTVRALRWLFA